MFTALVSLLLILAFSLLLPKTQKRKLNNQQKENFMEVVNPFTGCSKIKLFHFEDYMQMQFTTCDGEIYYAEFVCDYVSQEFSLLAHYYTIEFDLINRDFNLYAPNRTFTELDLDKLPKTIQLHITTGFKQSNFSDLND